LFPRFFRPPSSVLSKTAKSTQATSQITVNPAKEAENEQESVERESQKMLINGEEPQKQEIMIEDFLDT
jgi:hypothetical protein